MQIFTLGHLESGHQVTVSDLTLKDDFAGLYLDPSDSGRRSGLKLSDCNENLSRFGFYVLEFLYMLPEVMQFLDLPSISQQRGNIGMHHFSKIHIG